MSYFGLRAAPLGAATAPPVTGLFFSFHPAMVERSIPAAWSVAAPEDYLAARTRGVDAALRRLLGEDIDGHVVREATELARTAAGGV